MSLLITGGSGLLGSKIAELATKLGYKVYSCYLTRTPAYGMPIRADVQDKASIAGAFGKAEPDAVVHTAALTDVDRCETDRNLAYSINVRGTENIAELCRRHGSFLVYVSTDYVFDGGKGLYSEDDAPNPINYYGLTKLRGEEAIKGVLAEYCIVRPSVIYGSQRASGKVNFALWVIETLRSNKPINVVVDQWNSPTLNANLAEMILEIVERRLTGTYHLAGATRISRYEFARLIARVFELDDSLVNPVSSSEISWVAKRPRDSSLNVSKAMRALSHKPYDIERALSIMKEEYAGEPQTHDDPFIEGPQS